MKLKIVIIFVTVIYLLLSTAYSSADTVYDNFMSPYIYSPSRYALLYENNLRDDFLAMSFIPTVNSYYLYTIEIGLTISNGSNGIEVWLMNDNNGLPGNPVEIFNITNTIPAESDSNTSLVSMTSSFSPLLNKDSRYWIGVTPTGPDDSTLYWHYSRYHTIETYAWKNLNASNSTWAAYEYETAAFRVTGSVAPEPISSILFITGGSLLAGRRFIRRKT